MLEAAAASAAAAPPLESIENGRKVWRGLNAGEVWTEPGLNEPVQARPGWLTKLLADRVNATVPAVDRKASPADQRGGSAAFKINGSDVSMLVRGFLKADGSWQPL
jgi:hypothetical protein